MAEELQRLAAEARRALAGPAYPVAEASADTFVSATNRVFRRRVGKLHKITIKFC